MQWAFSYYRRLKSMLRHRGRTVEEAEDLIQETFLRVKIYLDQGHEIREPEAFLIRTALNLAHDARDHDRRDLYTTKPIEELCLLDTAPSPDEVLQAEQRLKQLEKALASTTEKTREVFFMHRLYGMTYEQIAAHFEVSSSAIEKHVAKAWSILGREVRKA
jgi:RNA polymerase sigma factor (sigma-70 family)